MGSNVKKISKITKTNKHSIKGVQNIIESLLSISQSNLAALTYN